MKSSRPQTLRSSALAAALVLPLALWAQEPALLPESIVIGEVLKEDPQGEPFSATFLSVEDIENFGITLPQDVTRATPNQFATDSGSRSFGDVYTTRGLANTVFFGSPGTTIYVDDVPFGETFTYAQDLFSINSIETFRGPQPTLVGRNAYGGLINIRSRRPTDVLEGSLNYGYGAFESHDADGWLMGPIAPGIGFRLGGMYDSRNGYLVNPNTGERVDDQEHRGINGGLFFNPAPFWEVNVTASYDEYNDGAPRLTSLDRTTGFYTVSSDVAGEQGRRANNQAIRVSYDDESFRFLSVTSHRGFELDPYTIDLDFTAAPIGYTSLIQSQELWSQEFRFAGIDPNADWNWNAGLYGSGSRIQGDAVRGLRFTDSRVDFSSQTTLVPFPPFGLVPLNSQTVAFSDTVADLQQFTKHSIDETSLAMFGGVDYKGFAPFTLHAGVRVDWIQRTLARDKSQAGAAVTDTLAFTNLNVAGIPLPSRVDSFTTVTPLNSEQARIRMQDQWVHVTPTIGVDRELGDHALAYARSTYAFKPGGFSAYADDVAFVPFQEERVWASEAGLKTEWLEGDLNLNVAGYYNAVENYQVERSFTVTDYAVFNAEEAEIYGLEFESRYAVLPVLDLLGSIGWTHARLTDYTDPVTGASLDGVIPPYVPEFDAVVALDFHLENGLFARAEYMATGETKFDDFNRPDFRQGGYGLLNLATGWRHDNMSIMLYGTNVNQAQYYMTMNPDLRTGAVGIPREYGVRVGVNF